MSQRTNTLLKFVAWLEVRFVEFAFSAAKVILMAHPLPFNVTALTFLKLYTCIYICMYECMAMVLFCYCCHVLALNRFVYDISIASAANFMRKAR